MRTMLTDRALKAMKPAAPGTRKMIWDSAVPSFGVRVSERGKVTFIVMRRLRGKVVRRQTISNRRRSIQDRNTLAREAHAGI